MQEDTLAQIARYCRSSQSDEPHVRRMQDRTDHLLDGILFARGKGFWQIALLPL